jgi:uncharacterized membrane protein
VGIVVFTTTTTTTLLSLMPLLPLQDEATLSQVRTMLMPVRREAVQLQKRLSRQELEAARQERIRKQLAAQEAQREAESQLKSSTWVRGMFCTRQVS